MFRCTICLAVLGLFVGVGHAEVVIETVPVGNPGNPDDTHGAGYGGVDYVYRIGKYEVTAGQYTQFLNKVGGVDTYGLYTAGMAITYWGSEITQSGGGTLDAGGTYTFPERTLPLGEACSEKCACCFATRGLAPSLRTFCGCATRGVSSFQSPVFSCQLSPYRPEKPFEPSGGTRLATLVPFPQHVIPPLAPIRR